MTHYKRGSLWLAASALVAGAMTGGCNSEATAEDATTVVAQTVEAASDSSDAVEVSSLMRGMHALRSDAVEGFHCDASPDITYIDVCGKSLPATTHLEWTDCAAPQRPGRGGGAGGVRPPRDGSAGGSLPPPPEGGGRMGGGRAPRDGSAGALPPPDKAGARGPHAGPSSGTVDIAYTYSTPEGCEGAVTQDQTVTFQISRTNDEGAVSTVQGTTSSSAQLVADAPPQQKSTQADVTRTLTDASGAVVRSVHLTGAMSVAFSSDTPPVRTLNGAYTEAFLDGTQGTVTLENIVRPPRNVCPWPTSGTLTRTSGDGESHTLVFGPECGTATLDGTAVELPAHRPSGGGRH